MSTPQAPAVAYTEAGVSFFNEADLLAYGLIKEEVVFTSVTSGITYRFKRLVFPADKTISASPVYVDREMGIVNTYYVFAMQLPGLLAAAPRFRQFPAATPGFQGFDAQRFSVVGPEWCVQGLLEFEAQFSANRDAGDLTMILSENLLWNANTRITRTPALVASLKRAAEIPTTLNMQTLVTGQPPLNIPGDKIVADPETAKFVQEKQLSLRPGNRANVIGRLQCLEIMDSIIVAAQQPVANAGFVPPPGGALTGQAPLNTPAGFVQAPQQSQYIAERNIQTTALSDGMKDRINQYLLESAALNKPNRLDSLGDAVRKMMTTLNEKYFAQGGFLNVTTRMINARLDNKKIGDVYGKIRGTNYPLRLAIPKEDLEKQLMHDPDPTKDEWNRIVTEGKYDLIKDSIMMMIADRINGTLGESLVTVNDEGKAVPSALLAGIPAGPSPAARPRISAKTPFVDIVPLSGVSDVTVPITMGTRCVPGLMTKKRD